MTEALTERCYLYRFFDVEGRLLYVGIARDLGSRFVAHRRRSAWWADVGTGTTETHPSRADAELAEAIAIHSEHPLHNVARPTEEKIGRLHDAASQSHDVTQLVAEVERLRALCGEQAVRVVKMRGNIEAAREGYRRMRAAYLAADSQSSYWARKYLKLSRPADGDRAPIPAAPTERVADWPRITAALHGAGHKIVRGGSVQLGSLTINGTERACEASSVDELRTGMIARCVAIAVRLHRPVRLTVNDGTQTMNLAVRPEGLVQLVDAAGMIPPAQGLTVHEGRCRICRRLQPVTEPVCIQCHTPEPHRVEVDPIDVQAVIPDAAEAVVPEVDADDELEHTIFVHRTPPRPARPTLRLSFNTQRSVDVDEKAALGRNPSSIDGRVPVRVLSPERMVSRTHALVDVDDDGRILVTDNHSANGVEAQTDPPVRLDPGVPYVIEPGTTLLMGDVACTIDVLGVSPSFR